MKCVAPAKIEPNAFFSFGLPSNGTEAMEGAMNIMILFAIDCGTNETNGPRLKGGFYSKNFYS